MCGMEGFGLAYYYYEKENSHRVEEGKEPISFFKFIFGKEC